MSNFIEDAMENQGKEIERPCCSYCDNPAHNAGKTASGKIRWRQRIVDNRKVYLCWTCHSSLQGNIRDVENMNVVHRENKKVILTKYRELVAFAESSPLYDPNIPLNKRALLKEAEEWHSEKIKTENKKKVDRIRDVGYNDSSLEITNTLQEFI